jgi:hypothetical protein
VQPHLYAAGAPVQYAHDLARLAVHVEVEVQGQQVAKHSAADAAERRLQDSTTHSTALHHLLLGSTAVTTCLAECFPTMSAGYQHTQHQEKAKLHHHLLLGYV